MPKRDGRKKNGGARPGAGRPSAAIEDDVRKAIRDALGRNPGAFERIWDRIISLAEDGSDKHSLIFLNYYYGKPKENEGQPTEMIIKVNRR